MSEQAAETAEIGLHWGGVRRSAFMIDMLIGHTVERPQETASLLLLGTARSDLPEALEDVTVEEVDAGHYEIRSGRRGWLIVHLVFLQYLLRSARPRAHASPSRWRSR